MDADNRVIYPSPAKKRRPVSLELCKPTTDHGSIPLEDHMEDLEADFRGSEPPDTVADLLSHHVPGILQLEEGIIIFIPSGFAEGK